MPFEVCKEMADGSAGFGKKEFSEATWLEKQTLAIPISAYLKNALDPGEASVIQLAMEKQIHLVAIDERVGRRMARLCGLKLTGSVGILLRAKKEGLLPNVKMALQRMQAQGIWLSQTVIDFALTEARE